MLEEQSAAGAVIFVVWQPMIATDWMAPGSNVLARLSDSRVRQYWDPDHLVARQLAADARAPQPPYQCCVRNGILWDLAAVYPSEARWTERLPPAVVFNGPVVDIVGSIRPTLAANP